VWDDQQMLKGVVNFYYKFQIYPDMFRQVIAIFRGLHLPYKLLQYCPCVDYGSFGASGQLAAGTERTFIHIRPKHLQ
jgi:hypothetical protein